MRSLRLTTLMASVVALAALVPPHAFAQVVPPAGSAAPAGVDSAIAHHDRAVAHRAARHGHYRKAAHAAHASAAASTDAAMAPH